MPASTGVAVPSATRASAGASFSLLAGQTTVPIFLLVPQVTLKKSLDVGGAARKWAGRLPGLVLQTLRD
jgi:hypothetical protein